jgi:hypothetical protein
MPLARIDLRKGKDANYRCGMSRVVYKTTVSIRGPANDRFQAIAEHDAENFACDPDDLGIARSDDLVIIRIAWNEGRAIEKRKPLFKSIAKELAKAVGIPDRRCFRHARSFGMGVARYAI